MAEHSDISVIETKLDFIQRDISDIKKRLDDNYVTKQEFDPVKRIVYGLVTLVLTAVVVALIALVVRSS